ncbi:MAG TPA: homoserine kinase [Nocardioides sp.]|nr:homoserine kinase [Nocardioides sp.]
MTSLPGFLDGPVTVTVPATSANLGPGYDALGLALSLRDRVTATVVDSPGPEIVVVGEGAGQVPTDGRHLVHRAMAAAFEHMGRATPSVRLRCENVIPHGRGLGSSSAAIVAGVCAARGLVAGGSLLMDDDAVFALAADLEGHPDNVAPAFYGGFTVAWADGGRFHAAPAAVDPRVSAVALVPPDAVETTVARGLLPATVSHVDAARNAGRAALLVAALAGRPELLLAATEDRLHQDFREPAMPRSLALVRDLRAAGLPAVVSGAGPTVLVLTGATDQEDVARRVPDGWRALTLDVERTGAEVVLG